MSKIDDAKPLMAKTPAIQRSVIACMLLALAVGCGDADAPPVYIGPGTGGFGASGGASGTGGTGGTGGIDGTGGAGGISGSGGTAGTGGTGSTGGTGGIATKSICLTPLDADFCESAGNCCETDNDCIFSGYVCIPSGCETSEGAAIKQCQPSPGGSCADVAECPNSTDYECIPVGISSPRCVKVTSGCSPVTESYDCAPGFSCEGGECFDRRVPCDLSFDCPKSHVCVTTGVASYCIRTHRTCRKATDCSLLGVSVGDFCENVDGDASDTKECIGGRDASESACFNSDCGGGSVCEPGVSATIASCGDYGLCLTDNDCGAGFECAALWQDGRKECVPTGGTCNQVTDCPLQQVCAAPRNGDPPSCQSGSAP